MSEKKITAIKIIVSDSHFQCPHCGETYIEQGWWRSHGETVTMTCDGEEGCGKEFHVEYNDPDHEDSAR